MQLRNGYPVGCFSGKGLTIAKELVCVICSDVARNITACNECDAAFCEACIQRFWMKEEHLRCPSCEVTWAPSEFVDGRVRLGDLVSFIHRDRKCEIILSSQTLCCPSLFCAPVAPRRGPTGLFTDRLHAPSAVTGLPPLTEEEEEDAQPKKRRRKSSNGASKGAAPQSSCTWTGSTADFDHHVLSCHPELASSAVCLAHLLRRMNEASKHDYLTKYFYVHEILKRFGNNDDLQLLSQSVVVSAFAAIVVEPFYEQERLRAITQGREVYFNRDTAERALVLDSFKGDFQAADCARPDPVAVVSHEFQVKHCVALLVLPYLCDTGLLQRRDVVRMDQRFTGWIYGTWSQRAAGASVEQQLALFEFALPQVSNHMLSQSGGCLLAMVSHVSFLNRVLLALLALPDEALDAPDVADRVTLLFSKCLLRLTYAMRLLGAWPDAIDRAAYARFVLQTLSIPFSNFGRIPAASRGFKLLELGVIPLLTANHRGFFHEAMLHGGAVRFINNQMTWILNRIAHAQQCAVETENRRRAAAADAVAARTQRRRGRQSRAQATDAADDVTGDVSAEEAAALARRELCAVLERDTLTLLENAFWVVARLLATPRMRSAREHTLSVQLIDSEIEDGLARLFRDEEAAELQAVALTLWLQTHRVADFRTLNSLLVRVMFGLVTAAGDLHSPLRCGALFAADGVADVRRLLCDDPAALELHEPERLLYQNLQRRGATSLAFRVDGDVADLADLVSARSALENLAALRDWWTRWLATRATGAEVSPLAAAAAPWATVDVEAGAVTRSLEAIAQMGAMDLEVTPEHQLITVPHRDGDGGGGADVVGGDEVGATLAMLRSVGASAVAPPDALPPASLFAASPRGGAEPPDARGDARKRRRSGRAAAAADAAHSTAAAAPGTDIAAALAAAQQPPDDATAGDERTAVLRYRFACEAAVFAKAAEGVDHVVLWQLFPPHAHFHVTDDRATLSLCAPSHVLPGATVSAELRALALREWVLAVCLLRGGGGGANRNESHALFADTAALAAHRLVFDEAAADAVTQLHQAPREPIDPVAFYSAAGDAPVDEASAAPPRHRLLHPTLVCPPSLLDALERRQQAAIAAATAAKAAAAEGGGGDDAKTTRTAAARKTAARGRASRGARSDVAPPPVEVGAFDDEGDDSGVVDVRTLLRAERQRRPPTKKKAAAAALSASTPPVDRLEELSAVAGLSAAQLALFASALTRDALAAGAANCLFFAPAAGGCASLILLTLLSEFVGAVRSLAQRRQDADALDALAEADASLRSAIDASDDAHAASLAGRAAGPAHKSFLPLAG